ncbi:type II secretion system F family protein [bacterium]|nr:type II secretion system F family protein [bacterium]
MTPSQHSDPRENLRDSMRSKIRGELANPEKAETEERPPVTERAARENSEPRAMLKREIHFGNPSFAQMTTFCRQLATLIEVGIPLVQSLNTLAQRIEHPKLKQVVSEVAHSVESGNNFADSLAQHPTIFSSLVVNVVRIGEHGGILEQSLNYLADLMERRYELRRRVAGAMAYPVVLLVVCFLALIVILGFAMPVFRDTYASMGNSELPGITSFVLAISDFVAAVWWLIIIVVVASVLLVRWLIKSNEGFRKGWDRLCFIMPVLKSITVKINVTRTCRTLANLIHAGIPLLEALRITAETSENMVVMDMLNEVHDHVERGGQIELPFREARLFPDLVVDMIAIGDEANRLDLMFEKIAETYDSDVEQSIRTLNAIVEPLMIVVMGVIVLVLALSVLLPYWQMAGTGIGEK